MTQPIATAAHSAAAPRRHRFAVGPVLWKLALEIGPLLVFFTAYQHAGIFAATGAYMGVTLLAALISYRREGKLPLLPLIGTVLVLVFGGLTLALDAQMFILIRPTIVNGLFASAAFYAVATGRPLMQMVFGDALSLTPSGWRGLTLRVALFLTFMAVLNEAVWRSFPLDAWVNFKVFAVLPLDAVFVAAMWPYVRRHHLPEATGETQTAAA
ncbi:septation protein A [Arenibaculum pallidiluteum]|uniref:septation protein A n=1 Tax=Arenibaculum pallidiluteum TaxID=2812559 RepID=UPI001A96E738|nr:septation protein A [Arenibaculum pallidiluteum]